MVRGRIGMRETKTRMNHDPGLGFFYLKGISPLTLKETFPDFGHRLSSTFLCYLFVPLHTARKKQISFLICSYNS